MKVCPKVLVLVGAVWGLACSALGPKVPQQPSCRFGCDAAIRFFVYSTGEHFESLPGIEVRLVASGGVRVIGATDRNGEFEVPKAKLCAEAASALLFCFQDLFVCAAVRLDDPHILVFDEVNVQLPLPTLIDRQTVYRSQ